MNNLPRLCFRRTSIRFQQQQQQRQHQLQKRWFQQEQQHLHQQPHLPPKPSMSSNPTVAAFQVVGKQLKVTLKYTGITAVSLFLATAIAWQSYHLYIEHYLESTPDELSYRARNLLHGAHVREHISPDYAVAANYIRQVINITLQENQQLSESSDIIKNLRLRLADDENRAGHVLEAITEYTRIWKLEPTLLVAKKLGDLYMRIGDQQQAEQFLTWAFQQLQEGKGNNDDELKITTLCSLASLYATQRQFNLALPLLLQALKSMPQDWICLKGIVQNQLCEVMYGMGKMDEALGWAQASLESSGQKDDQDCRECGGVVSNNLGRLLEMKGDFDRALTHYKQAVLYATESHDLIGQEQYEMNVQRLNEQVSQEKNEGTTVLSAVTSAIDQQQQPVKKDPVNSWLSGLFSKK